MVVINKIDRDGADPERALNESLDLIMDLGATETNSSPLRWSMLCTVLRLPVLRVLIPR
jgi:predicted membrane GTPase involved in stress response